MFDAADFYRNVARTAVVKLCVRMNEHEEIAKAALARDAETAVGLLMSHFHRTAERVREGLSLSSS